MSMDDSHPEVAAAAFLTQANALLRKSLAFQKRRWKTNLMLVVFPGFLCVLLLTMQIVIDSENNKPENKCGCVCLPRKHIGSCNQVCGVEYSTSEQAVTCAIPSPAEVPAMLQVPKPEARAVNCQGRFPGLPEPSCRDSESCPVVFLYTSQNRSFADGLVKNIFSNKLPSKADESLLPGTYAELPKSYYLEPALPNDFTFLSSNCSSKFFLYSKWKLKCSSTLLLWREDKQQIQLEIYHGFRKGNREGLLNEISVAYDFDETSSHKLDVIIFYNSSLRPSRGLSGSSPNLRVPRIMNMAAQAFLRTIINPSAELPLSFMKEMPKPETKLLVNFSLLLGPMFFMWVVQLLFPVILISLVYEKEANLRMMMRIHGLGDAPYWFINYVYHLIFSMIYIALFMAFGTMIGLDFFTRNSYAIQFTFYFVFMNLQIALAFLGTTLFSRTITATVCGYLYVFGFGLLGGFLFESYIEDTTVDRKVITVMELFPGFSLYRGLYELSQYSLLGINQGTRGMQWGNLHDDDNGLREVLVIITCEWLVSLWLSLCLDHFFISGFKWRILPWCLRKSKKPAKVHGGFDSGMYRTRPDVCQEREAVESLRDVYNNTRNAKYCIICDDLRKTYPGRDGNRDMHAVRGLSLGVQRGECFGMLGPNGAGKTTSIQMMIGLLSPTSGKTLVDGLELSKDLDKICTIMGVCPQQDLLWETLTGREHLLFYGRLKNLKGSALESAVEMSLKNVSLSSGGVPDKLAGNYSGGMKRRLSVAISLIGQTKAVYMDEPSTGLDPASRRTLWNAIKLAKQDRAIVLTTHSMEEAEALCDRVGIFVNGELRCIGTCKELKTRYGGSYIFTVTGDPSKEEAIASVVEAWSASAKRVYILSGTQKFEIVKKDIRLARVFRDMKHYKILLGITAWGLADNSLEDVFIKVASF